MPFLKWFTKRPGTGSFEHLVAPHIDYLYRLSYRFVGNREDAEDLVQDLLAKIYNRMSEMESIEKLRPWLARVLYRLFVDQFRQDQRRPLTDNQDVDFEEFQHPDSGPEQDFEQTIVRERLQQAYQLLNADQRALLALHDIEGYTLIELETMLETPLGTLKSRLHRARRQLREKL